MAVSTIKDLWELAATFMGGNYQSEIIDTNTNMSAPTTPLEKTFDQVYEGVRRSIFEEADWVFARNFKTLRKAPTVDNAGVTKEWDPGGRWQYVYEEPRDSIQFLGFLKDYADLELVKAFHRRPLPLVRKAVVNTSVQQTVGANNDTPTWLAGSFGGPIMRGSLWIELTDDNQDVHTVRDVDASTSSTYRFRWLDENDQHNLLFSYGYYNDDVDTILYIDGWSWDWSTAYPGVGGVTLNAVTKAQTTDSWDEFIFTNQPDAVGVYTVDVTDPSKWPVQFQRYVAFSLALEGAAVHAKSSKQVNLIDNRLQEARNRAFQNLSMDEGNLYSQNAVPTGRQARR